MSNVSGVIKSIQDIMRKDAGVDGDAQRIGQLVWMFFLKILDDQEESLSVLSDDYKSPIPAHLRWSAWATNPEGITGEALLDFINNQLFPKLKNLPIEGEERSRAIVIRAAFEDAYNYMKNGTLIRQVINKINEIDFNSTGDKHAFGDVYEQILKDLQSAGNSGEFYTPRSVTQFMVDMLDPKLDEMVLDPACGTGGFLAHVVDHKSDNYVQSTHDAETVQKTIFGVEKKALPHLLCVTNMMLHGIEAPTNIAHDNTLSSPLKDHRWRGKVDVIVTNPPFGGMEEDGIEKNVPQAFQTRETADLFLVLIIELLKDGGRAAVVLPDGTLFGEGIKTRIKEKLMTECNLHTIVRLPNGVFNPYTGIKTNLLFFEKGKPTEEVWFYEHPYPDGYKSYSKTKPMRIEEFEDEGSEKAWWGDLKTREGRKENDRAWKVSAEEIKATGYNLDISNPNIKEASHGHPPELLAAWEKNREELVTTQTQLKAALADALTQDGRQINAEMLLREFASLTSGPGGVQKMRELVLNLAISGRLSVRHEDDGDATALVQAAARTLKQAVKSGAIRKPRYFEKPASCDHPLRLPSNWVSTTLGNLGLISPRNEALEDTDSGFVPMAAIEAKYGLPHSFEQRRWGEIKSGYTHVANGDVVLAKITPCFENGKSTAIANLPNGIGAGTTELHVFRQLEPVIESGYLLAFLKSGSFIEAGIPKMTGTAGQKRIPADYFALSPFPLPPSAEQRRIVAKTDELMALCDLMEEQVHENERLNAELMASLVHALTETDPDGGGTAEPSTPPNGAPENAEPEEVNQDPPEVPKKNDTLTRLYPESEAQAAPDRAPNVDTKFQEAVLVAAIVKTFFQEGGEPIGNFRLQKAVYFARRKMGEHVGKMAYLKKAAGPYNPSMKYSGGIAIAKRKNWLREARGRFGFGHVPGAEVADAAAWMETYGYGEPARWVADHFRYKKNDEWEALATVDYAVEHLRSLDIDPDAEQIFQYITSDPEWHPKIEKLRLTEMSVGTAMLEVTALFNPEGEAKSV